jgi:hypothetical protein
MGLEGNPNKKSDSKISRRGFLAGAAAFGAAAAIGSMVKEERSTPEIVENNFDLLTLEPGLPMKYKQNLDTWMRTSMLADPRVVQQLQNFTTAIKAGKEPIFEGSIIFDTSDSLPQILENGDEKFYFSLNTNFKFTEGISYGVRLHEGEVVVHTGVGLNSFEKSNEYRERKIALGKGNGIFSASFIYNTHTGSMRTFPTKGAAEAFSDIFK